MNAHFLVFIFTAYFGVKALEFIASLIFGQTGPMANSTASRMLGFGA